MRDLSTTLLAAQQSAVLDPKVRITFSDPAEVEDDIVVEEDRIKRIPFQEEQSDKQNVEIIFDNSPDESGVGYFTDLDLKGWEVVFEWGLVTKVGAEYSAVAPLTVISQDFSSDPGVLECRISLAGIPNLLAEDKASKDYFHHWSNEKTVKVMITEIADGQPVTTTELTEDQEERDSYIDMKDGIHGAGQRLTITERTVTKLSFRLKKTGSPAGTNVFFRIRRATDDEATLGSKTFPISSISTSPAWCEVTFDSPVAVDEDVWIYCEHADGDTDNYISLSYNSFGVKALEWFMQVNAAIPYVTEWADMDAAYRLDYTITDGGGIDCFDHCTAYEVVYDDEGEDWFAASLLNTYMPKDAFKIYEGDSRLAVINRLLFYTGSEKRVRADGKIHVFVPTITGEVYNSEYSLESGHTFFNKAVRNALVIPNRIVVKSLKEDASQYSGEATDPVSYALLPITGRPIRTKLVDGDQAISIATAVISHLRVAAQRGSASVPMNLGSEVFDYDIVTDSRQEDSRVGNLGYIRRSYNPGNNEFNMAFSFGRVPLKSVAGTRPSLLRESRPTPEPTLDEAVLRWGMIKPTLEIIEENFELAWETFDNIIEKINEVIAALGYLGGVPSVYTKAEIDEILFDLLANGTFTNLTATGTMKIPSEAA